MKSRLISSLVISALAAFMVAAHAQEAAWQTSYQLETAGKYSDAIAALDVVPANGPDAELKALRRGWLYYLPGNFSDSIREYRLAIERNSRSIDARLGLTLPLLAQKRWREAEQSARTALELSPNNYTGLLRLVLALEGQRDWAMMAKTAAIITTSYPSDATGFVYLARAYAWQEKRADAVAAYQAVLVRVPGHLEAKSYIEYK